MVESDRVQSLLKPRAMRQANTVSTILGLTSSRSSGSAYTRAPIFLAMEMAYLPAEQKVKGQMPFVVQQWQKKSEAGLGTGRHDQETP